MTSEHILNEVAENLIDLGTDPEKFIHYLRETMEVTDQVMKLPTGLPLYDDEDRQALAEAIGARCDEFVTFNSRDFDPHTIKLSTGSSSVMPRNLGESMHPRTEPNFWSARRCNLPKPPMQLRHSCP